MEAEAGDAMEIGTGDDMSAESEVANDPLRRHEQGRPVLPSSGVDLKLSVEMEAYRERGPDESSAGTRTPDTPPEGPEDEKIKTRAREKEKGRKRKKYRRGQPNKKVWLWKKELAAAAEAGREGGGTSPALLRRQRSSAALPALPAPNNTTQFIMEDHTDLQALDLEAQRGCKTTRARDSSFSIESDEEFSSSPEDEAYLSKEFSNTYEDVHVERLGTMTKLDLIQEYLQLEQRVDVLEKKLKSAQNTSSGTGDSGGNGGTATDSDSEVVEGEMPMEPAMAEKIRIFQEEIQKLVEENGNLLQENQRLQSSCSIVRPSSSSLSSSIDSESDSSSSSGSSSSSSSGRTRASPSSGQSRGARSSPNCALQDKTQDIEMGEIFPISSSKDQCMETEICGEDSINKEESPSVIAH